MSLVPYVSSRRRSRGVPKGQTASDLKLMCICVGLPEPELEFVFHPSRKWRIDVAWPKEKLAVEIDGGVFLAPQLDAWGHPIAGGGRHTRGAGYRKDLEKFAELAILGWRVLRCLPEHVTSGQALTWIEKCLLPESATCGDASIG